MKTLVPLVAALALAITIPCSLRAQVTVGHDDSIVEIESPMKVEIGLGASPDSKGALRPPMNEGGPKIQRFFYEMGKYRVDKARISRVMVRRDYEGEEVVLHVTTTLATEWTRQDVNLRVALVSSDREVASKAWTELTIGDDKSAAAKMGALWSSSSKSPEAEFRLKREAWDRMFADGAAPVVRVILAIAE